MVPIIVVAVVAPSWEVTTAAWWLAKPWSEAQELIGSQQQDQKEESTP